MAGRTRRTLVHAPANLEPGIAVPLVCMLHGCTQDAASFAAATRMNDGGRPPRLHRRLSAAGARRERAGCWNWFEPRHQARGAGEPASIAAVVRELIGTTSALTVDPRRVFVAGLSAGGAMAAILAATYPDLFAAVAVHSGLAYGSADRRAGRLQGDGARRPRPGRLRPRGARRDGRPRPPRPEPRHPRQRRPDGRPGQREQLLAQSMAANRLAAPALCDADIARPDATHAGRSPAATPTSTPAGRTAAARSCTSG